MEKITRFFRTSGFGQLIKKKERNMGRRGVPNKTQTPVSRGLVRPVGPAIRRK